MFDIYIPVVHFVEKILRCYGFLTWKHYPDILIMIQSLVNLNYLYLWVELSTMPRIIIYAKY